MARSRTQFLWLAVFLLELSMSYQEESRNVTTLPRAEDNSRYKTIQANSTLLKLLMEPNKDENTRSEIFDMLHSKDSEFTKEPTGPAFPEDAEVLAKDVVSQPPNMQAELVQGAESIVERDSKVRMWVPGDHSQDTGGRSAVLRGAMSGIMVGVTCAIVLAAYIGLVAYKRHEMIKNGTKHELLRNEETTNETRIEL